MKGQGEIPRYARGNTFWAHHLGLSETIKEETNHISDFEALQKEKWVEESWRLWQDQLHRAQKMWPRGLTFIDDENGTWLPAYPSECWLSSSLCCLVTDKQLGDFYSLKWVKQVLWLTICHPFVISFIFWFLFFILIRYFCLSHWERYTTKQWQNQRHFLLAHLACYLLCVWKRGSSCKRKSSET